MAVTYSWRLDDAAEVVHSGINPKRQTNTSEGPNMSRKMGDDVSTNEVVWAAAERIGKASNAQDVNRICDYLISKHWFQTAGDLRVARENAQEWLALEVPSRLKIAIQEVLDAPLETAYSPGKTRAQSDQSADQPARAMALDGSFDTALECQASTSEADQSAVQQAFYGQEAADQVQVEGQVLTTSDASTYHDPSFNEIDTQSYDSSFVTDVPVDAAAVAAHAAAWEAYYAANGYYGYGTTEQPTTDSWDYSSYDNSAHSLEEVVEAQEVVVEEAIAVESPLIPCGDGEGETTCESAVPTQCETWSCGQCTYINRIDVSFCEMCCGHYSLSHAAQLTPPGVSTLDENERAEISPEVIVVDLQDSNPSSEATQDESMFYQHPGVDKIETQDVAVSTPSAQPTHIPALQTPLYVSIPSPSKPMSPLYSPSAPDFEEPEVQADHSSKPLHLPLDSGKIADISSPTPVLATAPSPSPPKVDYRSLAFKRTPSMPSTSVHAPAQASGISSPPRSHTEFSF